MKIYYVKDAYRRSVLNINVLQPNGERETRGTGSVIRADEKRTLLLTAAHVLLTHDELIDRFARQRLSLDDLQIIARTAEGKEFPAKCLPIITASMDEVYQASSAAVADIAFLEAETSAVGEILPALGIARRHDPQNRNFEMVGFPHPEMMVAVDYKNVPFNISESLGNAFFYMYGTTHPGFSGAPLFEAGKTEIVGVVAGIIKGGPVVYGASYATILARMPALVSTV